MEEKLSGRQHRLTLQDRSAASVTGVEDVVSFDGNTVVLETNMGLLTVRGKELHVTRLNLEKGETDLEGTVDSLTYSAGDKAGKSGDSVLARLFR